MLYIRHKAFDCNAALHCESCIFRLRGMCPSTMLHLKGKSPSPRKSKGLRNSVLSCLVLRTIEKRDQINGGTHDVTGHLIAVPPAATKMDAVSHCPMSFGTSQKQLVVKPTHKAGSVSKAPSKLDPISAYPATATFPNTEDLLDSISPNLS